MSSCTHRRQFCFDAHCLLSDKLDNEDTFSKPVNWGRLFDDPGLGCKCIKITKYNVRLAFPAALAMMGHMLPEPLPMSRCARWRLSGLPFGQRPVRAAFRRCLPPPPPGYAQNSILGHLWSRLVISGNLWSSPGVPMPSTRGPECAAKRPSWHLGVARHRWPFPLPDVRPANTRKLATKQTLDRLCSGFERDSEA